MRLVSRFVAPAVIVLAVSGGALYELRVRYQAASDAAASAVIVETTLVEAGATARIAYSEKLRFEAVGLSAQSAARRKEQVVKRNLQRIDELADSEEVSKAIRRLRKVARAQQFSVGESGVQMDRALASVVDLATKLGAERRAQSEAALTKLFNSVVFIVLGAISISLLIYAWLATRISRPLRKLLGFADAVARGEPTPPLPAEPVQSEVGRLVSAFDRMLGALRRDKELLERLAYIDESTNLPNEHGFLREVDRIRSAPEGACDAVIALMRFPRLTQIEALFGQEERHRAESAIAARLRDIVKKDAARLDGSEGAEAEHCGAARWQVGRLRFNDFTVYQPCGDDETIKALRAAFDESIVVGARSMQLAPMIGVAHAMEHGAVCSELVNAADIACEAARDTGGLVIFREEMRSKAIEDRDLEMRLRRAIGSGEIEPFYQPKICCRSGRIIGAEALARWRLPDGELISPGVFIPCAERAGLTSYIDYEVLRIALRQTAQMQAAGHDVSVAVNLSAAALEDPNLSHVVSEALLHSGVKSVDLELEITETAAMSDMQATTRLLEPLRSQGVRVALDDFGTGYSSLGSLMSLPIDTLKMDRSFLPKDESDEESIAICEAVITLARRLRLSTVAEGIETEWQAEFINTRGCDIAQGFLYGRPLSVTAYRSLLESIDLAQENSAAS